MNPAPGPDRVSWDEYFAPQQGLKYVTRRDLRAILAAQDRALEATMRNVLRLYHREVRARRWFWRLWRWIRNSLLPHGARWRMMTSDERVAAVVGLVRVGKPEDSQQAQRLLAAILQTYPLSPAECGRARQLLQIEAGP